MGRLTQEMGVRSRSFSNPQLERQGAQHDSRLVLEGIARCEREAW